MQNFFVFANENPNKIPMFLQLLFRSMEKNEMSDLCVQNTYFTEKDKPFCEKYGINTSQNLRVYCEMLNFSESHSLYENDCDSHKMCLLDGVEGLKPCTDSKVKFHMKIKVNDKIVFSNFLIKPLVRSELHEFLHLNEDTILAENSPIIEAKLNEYKLPPILSKSLKTMNLNSVSKITCSNFAKLLPYIHQSDSIFNPDYVKPNDTVIFYIYLIDIDNVFLPKSTHLKKAKIIHRSTNK